MKEIKKLFIFLLVFTMAVVPVQVMAAEMNECEHNYVFDSYHVDYTDFGDYHRKEVFPIEECTICGHSNFKYEETKTTNESHNMGAYTYTGNNYHSGSKHYLEYSARCIQCGHYETKLESYSCPGNPCILPQSLIYREVK